MCWTDVGIYCGVSRVGESEVMEEGSPRAKWRLMRARETLVRVCPDVWFRTTQSTPSRRAAPASLDRGGAHFFGTSLCRWWFMPKG